MFQLMTLAALTLTPTAPVPDVMPLQWKLKKGDVIYVKTTYECNSEETLLSKIEKKTTSKWSLYSKYEILEANDKGYKIEQYIEKDVRSADDVKWKLDNVRLIYVTDRRFEIAQINGIESIIKKLGDNDKQQEDTLRQLYNENSLSLGFSDVFEPGPDRPVKVGDNWKRATIYTLGSIGAFQIDRNYKYLKDGDYAKVSYEANGKFVPATDPNIFAITGEKFKIEKSKGEYEFDLLAGRLISSKSNFKCRGDLVNDPPSKIKRTIVDEIKMETTVSDKSLVPNK